MLLSFSVPVMLPYIRAGLRQRAGEDVGGERVKRQTIRRRETRNAKLAEYAKLASWSIPYDLHLWWKSRTHERELIGKIDNDGIRPIRLYPISILHSTVIPPEGPAYHIIRIDGPHGWCAGDPMLFWSEGREGRARFEREAYADGFDAPQAFRDFFVPNVGDRFDGVLFKW